MVWRRPTCNRRLVRCSCLDLPRPVLPCLAAPNYRRAARCEMVKNLTVAKWAGTIKPFLEDIHPKSTQHQACRKPTPTFSPRRILMIRRRTPAMHGQSDTRHVFLGVNILRHDQTNACFGPLCRSLREKQGGTTVQPAPLPGDVRVGNTDSSDVMTARVHTALVGKCWPSRVKV